MHVRIGQNSAKVAKNTKLGKIVGKAYLTRLEKAGINMGNNNNNIILK